MQKTIQQTTEHYLSSLPADKQFYQEKDLKSSGFPSFLIRHIQLALSQELVQSISLPHTNWADVQDETVTERWEQFIHSLQNSAHIPAGQIEPILERAVTDIIHVLVQPRQNIPELLFGEEETLSAEQLNDRVNWLVVYPHFGQVLSRYLQKKGKNELYRQKCVDIIARIDEKITRNYTPFQWAGMLQPLFELTNAPVQASLFHLFFEDRQLEHQAQKFKGADKELTLDEFVDVLIGEKEPDAGISEGNGKGKETDDSNTVLSVFESDFTHNEDENEDLEPLPIEIDSDAEEEPVRFEPAADPVTSEDAGLNQMFSDTGKNGDENAGQKKETPDNEQGTLSESFPEGAQHISEREEAPASLNDIFSDGDEEEKNPIPDDKTSHGSISIFSEPDEINNDEVPIWQRFVDPDDDHSGTQLNENPEMNNHSAEHKNDLREYMRAEEGYFIRSLFNRSEQSYLKTLEDINKQDYWKEAYKLVEKQVFKPNKVDIYSKAAVDFTDRLQNYFQKR